MGSENSPLKLPVIDFSKTDLNPGSPEWDMVKSQVFQALEEYGCFEALFDEIHMDCCEGIFGAIEEVFDLPSESKMLNVSDKPMHGYIGQIPRIPLFESLGIEDANIAEKVESMTNVLWPQGNPSFSETIQSYSDHASELDQLVRKMIIESLGLEKHLDEHIKSTYYLFRATKYGAPKTTETKVGLTSHTDNSVLTTLYPNQVVGLEFQTKDGEWIKVVPSPHSFIVLVGVILCAWTNGRLHAPYHRVMLTGNEARYCAALFTIPKEGYIIKVPEELIDEEHTLLFRPFNVSEFLRFCHSEASRGATSKLKAYCGV